MLQLYNCIIALWVEKDFIEDEVSFGAYDASYIFQRVTLDKHQTTGW